jgi:hypothetical protein
MFRPSTDGERPREMFLALVERLRGLRERGLIDLPELCVAVAGSVADLSAGPCHVTGAGRAALEECRRG